MKYAIDSKGEAIRLENSQSYLRQIDMDIRRAELYEAVGFLRSLLSEAGINSTNKKFCYLFQPSYTGENLYYFARTEFSSSSKAVKLANELEKHPEILADRGQREVLQSIFSEDTTGRIRWYFLTVGCISFERNFYDCKYINAVSIKPVPYTQFMRELKEKERIQPNEDGKTGRHYTFFNEGFNLEDTTYLLSKAFERDIADGITSDFDITVATVLEQYKKQVGISQREKNSNKITTCISAINQNRNIFPVYKEVKNCIKKTFKDAYNVSYKGTRITAQINDKTLSVYVTGTDSNPQFIIGGKAIRGIERLKEELLSPTLFNEAEWFRDKVKPYISVNNATKKRREHGKNIWK